MLNQLGERTLGTCHAAAFLLQFHLVFEDNHLKAANLYNDQSFLYYLVYLSILRHLSIVS